jgi:signal transduction histidine kinase
MRAATLFIIVALVAATQTVSAQGTADEDFVSLDRAEFVVGDRERPPADDATWEPRSLPDFRPVPRDGSWIWSNPGAGEPVFAWYRLRLPQRSHTLTGAQAMFLSLHGGEAVAFVNGTLVEAAPSFQWPGRGPGTTRAQWFGLTSVLRPRGDDVVHVRIALRDANRDPTTVALSPVIVAAQNRLSGPLMWERFWRDTLPIALLGFTATIGLLMLALAQRAGNRTLYYACGAAAFNHFSAHLLGVSGGGLWMEWLTVASLLVFGHRMAPALFAWAARPIRDIEDRRPRAMAATVIWFGIVIALSLILEPGVPLLFGFILCFIQMAGIAWGTRSSESTLLACAHAFSVFALAREILWPHLQGLDWTVVQLVPAFLVMTGILVQRLGHALVESERLNAELDQRVRDKQAELEANFERLRQLTRDAAVVEERQRIMSDMHDGIGAQLISALSLAEQGDASSREVAAALRECIDDLRLTIDSLEPTDNDLLPALGNFRYRLEGRLKALGVQLDWQAHELPPLANLTPRTVLHVLRILQEAFTNVLKHARASRIRVETGTLPERRQAFIRVSDDGEGFANGKRPGRGLGNMQRRAAAAGGELSVTPTGQGTTVELRLAVA